MILPSSENGFSAAMKSWKECSQSCPQHIFTGGEATFRLLILLDNHFKEHGPRGSFATEVDIIIDQLRVAVADAVFLTTVERERQNEASRRLGNTDARRTRILVPPTLIIESVSPGHELHDHRTKRRWYADFGVPNYWVLDAFQRSLECLMLEAGEYRCDQTGQGQAHLSPAAFPGLQISLNELWDQ